MTILFIADTLGTDTGPFSLYSDVDGFLVPFETGVTRAELLSGFTSSNVPDFTTEVQFISETICGEAVNVIPQTTSTTSTVITTSTTTTAAPIECDESTSFSGGLSYPSLTEVQLGSATGEVEFYFDPDSLPDRFIVKWNGSVVIDTGYRGNSIYNLGGTHRNPFKNSLLGKIDPITSNVYPDFATYPSDGYPLIVGPGEEVLWFTKDLTTPSLATVEVYAPQAGTGWSFTMFCPVTTTTSTTAVPTTTTTSTTIETIPCDAGTAYDGGVSYPSSDDIELGSTIGEVQLSVNAFNVPDRYIVTWNGAVVIDTGYRGQHFYQFGGANRYLFNNALLGKTDPITLNVYPDFATYPDDGYPPVTTPGSTIVWFSKTLASPTTANVKVYAPMGGTAWNYTMFCPVTTTTTTTVV